MKSWRTLKVQDKTMTFLNLMRSLPLLLVSVALLNACDKTPESQLLVFEVTEQNIQPYHTRVIVTPERLRMDDGEGSKSYTLYDRKQHIARTVDTELRTILEMHPKSVQVEPPFALKYSVKDLGEMKDAPKIMGKIPKHYQDYANEQLCFDVITVAGLMPQAVQALQEFQQLLASDSAVTFNNMPADMQDPCSIAMDTFAPTRFLQHGFPIQQWRSGYSRMLIDFKDHYQADPKLFELPAGYFTYTVQQIRDGVVDLDGRKIVSPPTEKKNDAPN
jgi:hypothetical protein